LIFDGLSRRLADSTQPALFVAHWVRRGNAFYGHQQKAGQHTLTGF
jgi:hypothetical protein